MRAITRPQRLLHLASRWSTPHASLSCRLSSTRLSLSRQAQAHKHTLRYCHREQTPLTTPTTARWLCQSSARSHLNPYWHSQAHPSSVSKLSKRALSSYVSSNRQSVTSLYYIPDPSQTNPSNFISQLPQLSDNSRTVLTQALFLVTPKLAHWFELEGEVLGRAIDRIYSPLPQDILPVAFVAVVDGLPGPDYFADGSWDQAPTPYVPAEGVALYLSSRVRANNLMEGEASGKALVQIMSDVRESRDDVSVESKALSTGTVLSIPVANTLFLNCKENTLFGTAWSIQKSGDSRRKPSRLVDLSSVEIVLGVPPQKLFDVHVPLYELTQPRRVVSSMGNVVREVEGDDGKSLRASAELEAEVPRFLARMKEEGSEAQIQVFARVRATSTNGTAQSQPTTKHEKIALSEEQGSPVTLDDLGQGCQMYRVTSGGGGWGKKAGLLSLDPATNFDPPKSSESSMFPDPDADEPTFGSLPNIGALVPTGRTIQFFAAKVQEAVPPTTNDNPLHRPPGDKEESKNVRQQKWLFGNFAQAEADQMPSAPSSTSSSSVEVLPDCFGAFSYSGAAIALHERTSDNAPAAAEVSNEFRIDAPFATFKATTRPDASIARGD